MGRRFKYNLTPERIEELYQTEMDEESKNIWSMCVEWLQNYTGASKQLIDIRVREWNNEYQHNPLKTVGLTAINKSTKGNDKLNYSRRQHGTKCFERNRYIGDNMTDFELDIADIKLTLNMMKEHIKTLEAKLNRISPQCFTYDAPIDKPLSLSEARSMWPMLEKEFDEYCAQHCVTTWTPTDSENFYREFVRCWC